MYIITIYVKNIICQCKHGRKSVCQLRFVCYLFLLYITTFESAFCNIFRPYFCWLSKILLTSNYSVVKSVLITDFEAKILLITDFGLAHPWAQWTLSCWSIGTWTMSTKVHNVHSVHGYCPLSPWTMSTQSMDNVHWDHGLYPLNPWTVSTQIMEFFPWVFPTLYLVKNYSNPTKLNAYIQFTMHVIYTRWKK